MKTKILSILTLALFGLSTAYSQVGIGTTTPATDAVLDLTATNKALLLPRVANVGLITNPVNGMIIYDILSNCIRAYENGAWSACFNGNAAIGIVPNICDPTNPTAVVEVQAGGHIWMDRNLGASRAATGSLDFEAYGNLFQWGRNRDGHECINWVSANASDGAEQSNESSSQSSLPNPGSTFITSFGNWYNGTNPNDLWKPDLTGVNNPCPAGYRVPSETELSDLGITNAGSAYSSIGLPMAGYRFISDGSLNNVGTFGFCWSSTVSSANSRFLGFNSSIAYMSTNHRAGGFSVRCLKD